MLGNKNHNKNTHTLITDHVPNSDLSYYFEVQLYKFTDALIPDQVEIIIICIFNDKKLVHIQHPG
jgi:hypothetical protein